MRLASTTLGEHGPRITLLHGLFGQGRNWTTVAKALSEDFRVTLLDLPNHGRSPWTEDLSYPATADAVAALLAEQDEPGTLVGHSMGGKVAMVLALRRAELVPRLCVIDIAPVAYGDLSGFAGYVAAMQGLDLDRLAGRWEASAALAPAVPDPVVRAFLLQNLRREGTGWRWQVNLELLGRSLPELGGWPDLETPPYPGPVLWVAGERSDYVIPAYGEAMRRQFPRTQLLTVKDAGHWVHAERPEVVVTALRRFAAR